MLPRPFRWCRRGVPNRFDDQRLDRSCGYAVHGPGTRGGTLEQGGRQIVSVFDITLAGMARAHAVAKGEPSDLVHLALVTEPILHLRLISSTTPSASAQ